MAAELGTVGTRQLARIPSGSLRDVAERLVQRAVPHLARWFAGPDYRWTLALSTLLGPALLLLADVIGRVIARPGEIEAGLVVAFLGAPVLIALVRNTKAVGL